MKKLFVLLVVWVLAFTSTTFAQTGNGESGAVSLTSRAPSPAPELVGPRYPNLELLSCRAYLFWENIDHALTYNVQIANDYQFTDIVGTYTGIEDTNYAVDLPANSTYYFWRVSATNRAGTGSYGYSLQFETSDMTNINVGENAAPTITDIDGDGLLDMLVGNKNGRISRYEQSEINSFSFNLITSYFNNIDVGTCNFPTVTDLDDDGLLDLIMGRDDGTLRHFEQDSDRSASFTLVGALSGIDVGGYSKPTFTDLDRNGRLDLLVGNLGGAIYHYQQDSGTSTTFTLVSDNFNSIDVGELPSPMFCYYDNNSRYEFFIGNVDGQIQLYQQSGIASLSFSRVTTNWNDIDVGDKSVLAQTDLNGDRRVDLLVGSDDGIVGIKKGSSDTYYIDPYCIASYDAESITATTAEFGGNVYEYNGVTTLRRGVCYSSTNKTPTLADEQAPMGSGFGFFSGTVTSLAPNTTYYHRTFCSNCYGTFYGNVKSFTTDEGTPQLAVKVYLQGPYDSGAHNMGTNLAGIIPATSFYSDNRNAGSIPEGITDWVCMELRSTVDGEAVYSRSYILRSDGYLAEDDGTVTNLTLTGLAPGDYYIVIRHRNHLAIMSATAQSLSGTLTTYNFTVDESTPYDKYYGGSAAQLETGIYGMFSGDANNSGIINATDYLTVKGQSGSASYNPSDCNMNGSVNATDYLVVKPNSGKNSQVP